MCSSTGRHNYFLVANGAKFYKTFLKSFIKMSQEVDVIKLLIFVNDELPFRVKFLQPSLIFVGKAKELYLDEST
jgi:hypothetical protein